MSIISQGRKESLKGGVCVSAGGTVCALLPGSRLAGCTAFAQTVAGTSSFCTVANQDFTNGTLAHEGEDLKGDETRESGFSLQNAEVYRVCVILMTENTIFKNMKLNFPF